MERTYIEEKDFDKVDFTATGVPMGDYENCSFVNCNFLNTDLSNISFSECAFIGCNVTLAKLSKTSFRDIKFKDCKLLGLHFNDCDAFLFAVDFENCFLNLSSFYKLKLKKTSFKN